MEPLAKTITELELADGARVFIAPMHTKDVVTVEGSVLGGSSMLPAGKEVVHSFAAELLDAGTKKRTKDQLREALSTKGISLSFGGGIDRTFFSASCLPEDFAYLMDTIAECLSEATFPSKELSLAKERALAELEQMKTDTNARAAQELNRSLFDQAHFNHPYTIEQRASQIAKVTRADLLAFSKMLGCGGFVLAVTGDITPTRAERAIRSALAKLPVGTTVALPKKKNSKKHAPAEILIPIKDKANIDTFFGAAVPITYDHPLFLPFLVLSDMLGGRGLSNGHLMRTIRERDGLTYGIRALPGGFAGLLDGYFSIWATFSPATFKLAVKKTREEILAFLKSGVNATALLQKQDQLAGSYIVGLSTTRGLASTLHGIGIEGKPLSYIDAYPDLIRAITVDDLKSASKLVPFNKLTLTASGSFLK